MKDAKNDPNIGLVFGEWTILNLVKDPRPGTHYECICGCGKVQNVHFVSMKMGRSKRCYDCGRRKTSKSEEMIGIKIGKWTVLSVCGTSFKSLKYLCRCDCGEQAEIHGPHLRNKKTTQCRLCSNREKAKKNISHGKSRSSTYKIWNQIHQRCKNPKATGYHRYGGRGISVCERWHDFRNFLYDMGERPDGLDLDRINNDGNYEPSNCRWVTHRENCQNQAKGRRAKK